MRRSVEVCSSVFLMCASHSVLAFQSDRNLEVRVDLMTGGVNQSEEISLVKSMTVVVNNLLPKYRNQYVINTSANRKPFEPITISKIAFEENSNVQNVNDRGNLENNCSAINQLITELTGLEKESDVTTKVEKLSDEMIKAESISNCSNEIIQAKSLIQATRTKINFSNIRQGMDYIVKISRKDKDQSIEWGYTYSTEYSGEWLTHYGFTFLDNKNKKFYSKRINNDDETVSYQVAEEIYRDSYNYLPALLFTYVGKNDIGERSIHGLSFGLGVDLNQPTVLGGYSYLYGTNIMLTAGLAFSKFDSLSGRYKVGESLDTEISSDNLTSSGYDHSYFISLSFRFGDSPFKRE